MLRCVRLTDPERLHQFADTPLAVSEQMNHRKPLWISQRLAEPSLALE